MEKLDFRQVIEWPFADMSLGYFAAPDDDTCMIELIGGGEQPPANPPVITDLAASLKWGGFHHLCFYVASVDAAVATLKARGVVMVGDPFVLDDIGRRLAFFADPGKSPLSHTAGQHTELPRFPALCLPEATFLGQTGPDLRILRGDHRVVRGETSLPAVLLWRQSVLAMQMVLECAQLPPVLEADDVLRLDGRTHGDRWRSWLLARGRGASLVQGHKRGANVADELGQIAGRAWIV